MSFFDKKFFLKTNNNGIIKITVQINLFKGKTKLSNKANNDKNILPYIPISGNESLLFLNT